MVKILAAGAITAGRAIAADLWAKTDRDPVMIDLAVLAAIFVEGRIVES